MNTRFFETAILNLDSNMIATGLEIGFSIDEMKTAINYNYPTLADIQMTVEDVVTYWCDSNAITDGNYSYTWINKETLRVVANFRNGGFQGDLTHRNALTKGDGDFKIGLAKMFYLGHATKKRNGGVKESAVYPIYIQVQYTSRFLNSQYLISKLRQDANDKLDELAQWIDNLLDIINAK